MIWKINTFSFANEIELCVIVSLLIKCVYVSAVLVFYLMSPPVLGIVGGIIKTISIKSTNRVYIIYIIRFLTRLTS